MLSEIEEVVRQALAFQSALMNLVNMPDSPHAKNVVSERHRLLQEAIDREYESRKTVG